MPSLAVSRMALSSASSGFQLCAADSGVSAGTAGAGFSAAVGLLPRRRLDLGLARRRRFGRRFDGSGIDGRCRLGLRRRSRGVRRRGDDGLRGVAALPGDLRQLRLDLHRSAFGIGDGGGHGRRDEELGNVGARLELAERGEPEELQRSPIGMQHLVQTEDEDGAVHLLEPLADDRRYVGLFIRRANRRRHVARRTRLFHRLRESGRRLVVGRACGRAGGCLPRTGRLAALDQRPLERPPLGHVFKGQDEVRDSIAARARAPGGEAHLASPEFRVDAENFADRAGGARPFDDPFRLFAVAEKACERRFARWIEELRCRQVLPRQSALGVDDGGRDRQRRERIRDLRIVALAPAGVADDEEARASVRQLF